MIEKNGIKFVTLKELADCLNQHVPPENAYRIPELAQGWADARAKFYGRNGAKVREGEHYLTAEDGEQLLSAAGCALVECLAVVDNHTVPVMRDGAEELFES